MEKNKSSIITIYISAGYIQKYTPNIVEGEIRAKDLCDYLTKFNLPKVVWLSEDATGILPKIQYDSATSQLIGQVLPVDKHTGIPISNTYMARSFEEIKKHVTNASANKSTLAYIIVAQALDEKAPPFILSIHGTDNKFNCGQILNRWKFVEAELARYYYFNSYFINFPSLL